MVHFCTQGLIVAGIDRGVVLVHDKGVVLVHDRGAILVQDMYGGRNLEHGEGLCRYFKQVKNINIVKKSVIETCIPKIIQYRF